MTVFLYLRAFFGFYLLPALVAVLLLACQHPEKDKAAHLARGQQYLKDQLYAEARIEFRSALQIDHNLADAHHGLGEASLALGNLQEAAEQFQLAAKLDANNLDARLRLGQMLLQHTRIGRQQDEAVKEAERLANEVLAKDANRAEAFMLLADVRSAQKRYEDAKAELERAIKLNPDKVEPHLALARFYERRAGEQGTNEAGALKAQADAAFKTALAKNPQSAPARLAYGDFLYAGGHSAEAEQQLLQAFQHDPQNKLVLVAVRRFYENQFRYDEAEKYLARQIELEPDKVAGRAQIIDLHARAGRNEQAIGEYQQLLKDHPDFQRGYARLAELLLAQGRPNEAKQQLEAAFQRNKQDTDALLVRGRIRTLEGNYREAIIDLEQALRLEPALPAALYYTSDAYLQNNDPVRARALVNSLLGYYPRHPMGLLMLIRIHLHQAKHKEALETAGQLLNVLAALKTSDTDFQATRLPPEALKDLESKAYTARAVARMQLGDYSNAQSDLARASEIDTRAAEPHINLATIHLLKRDLPRALAAAEKAVELAPNSPAAVATLIDVYLAQKNYAAALAKLDALRPTQADQAALLFQQSRVYDAQGDAANTEKTLRQAIETDPNYLNAYFALSDFYKRRNLYERAIGELQAIIQSNRQAQQIAQAHLLTGLLEEERGRYSEAINHYEKALSFDNRSLAAAIAYNNLAWLYADKNLGNLDKASDYAQRAVTIAPEASFFDTLGYAYYKKGQHSLAAEQFNKAIERRPANAGYYLHLARALRENNETQRARQAYEKVLQLGRGDFAEANQARQEMAALPRG
jgi:tetratricopeptide (TPR) repeat protein